MNKKKQIFSLVVVSIITAIICSCNQVAEPSLYMQELKGSTPVISGILPANEALSGVTDVTISGSNFSATKEDNYVYFGTAQATVLQATATSLVVKAPTLIQKDLNVKVGVKGIEDFSNVSKYSLLEAVGVYFAFAKGVDDPMTVATDKDDNVYVYLNNKGVKKITSDGKISDYAPKGAESFFFDMKFGPNNILYGTRNLRAVFQVEAGKASATYTVLKTGVAIVAIDFDKDNNMWAAGTGGLIYRIKNVTKDTLSKPIDYSISSIKVYDGYLYAAGKKSTEEAIYRYKINADASLAAQEKYFDIGAKYGLGKVNIGGIAFSSEGELIIGADQTDAFISINSAKTVSSFYPGIIFPAVKSMMWGTKRNLFYIREYIDAGIPVHTLVRVDMQKLSAPYYGR